MSGGQIPALRYGCLAILEIFRRLSNHGLAVTDSENFTKERQDRRMTRQMRSCTTDYANTEMKKMRLNART